MSTNYGGRKPEKVDYPASLPAKEVRTSRTGRMRSDTDPITPWKAPLHVIQPPAKDIYTSKYLEQQAGVFNVLDYGAKGDGVTDDTVAIQDALAAALAASGTLVFPARTYIFSETLNFGPEGTNGFSVIGVGGQATLQYTGPATVTGSEPEQRRGALEINGNAVSNQLFRRSWNVRVENITLRGNSNVTIGWLFRHAHHCVIRNVRVMDMASTGTAFQLEHTVLNLYENLICTANEENGSATMPRYGVVIDNSNQDGSGLGANTQGNTFLNVMIEGLDEASAVGVWVKDGARNFFYGGSCENSRIQVLCDSGTQGNVFNGMYMEDSSNSPGVQAIDRGNWNQWVNVLAAGDDDSAEFQVESGATHCTIIGGEIDHLVIESGAEETFINGTTVVTLSDGGTRTFRWAVYDDDAGVHVNNTVASRMDFNPDATHDIGTTSASRPRDGHFSRRVIVGTDYQVAGTQVLSARKTGWGAPTGVATRTTFATGTVTLPQLAERVKALIDDLTSHGAIGA